MCHEINRPSLTTLSEIAQCRVRVRRLNRRHGVDGDMGLSPVLRHTRMIFLGRILLIFWMGPDGPLITIACYHWVAVFPTSRHKITASPPYKTSRNEPDQSDGTEQQTPDRNSFFRVHLSQDGSPPSLRFSPRPMFGFRLCRHGSSSAARFQPENHVFSRCCVNQFTLRHRFLVLFSVRRQGRAEHAPVGYHHIRCCHCLARRLRTHPARPR
jgi:hypothetical protein